jgi:hypothetical protein
MREELIVRNVARLVMGTTVAEVSSAGRPAACSKQRRLPSWWLL